MARSTISRKSAQEPVFAESTIPRNPAALPFVKVAPGGRYFVTETGEPFLMVGHNDAMTWPNMNNMHYDHDIATTEAYIRMLAEHGVTVMRIMLEYAQDRFWYFEKPVGKFVPEAVLYWDNLVGLCERYGIRLLVIFWDTFFMYRRWKQHPYSKQGTGFENQASFCVSPEAFEVEKNRIRFFVDRWGDSGAIFGYDLFNEIDPAWGGTREQQYEWVTAMSRFVRDYEMERWGKRHLLTVSCFGPTAEGVYADLLYRHPNLDFATTHVYTYGLVDNPKNAIDCVFPMRDAVLYAYEQITDPRPYTDSEHGPIHLFIDLKKQLPQALDEEYFHNMAWVHLATGAAGGALRWPFRNPHCLTPGMHDIQAGMSRFHPALDWANFSPRPTGQNAFVVEHDSPEAETVGRVPVLAFGCSDERQALVWLLRDLRAVEREANLPALDLALQYLAPGEYEATFWETYDGNQIGSARFSAAAGSLARVSIPDFGLDLAIAIRRQE